MSGGMFTNQVNIFIYGLELRFFCVYYTMIRMGNDG